VELLKTRWGFPSLAHRALTVPHLKLGCIEVFWGI
jgi:hypothetical protein